MGAVGVTRANQSDQEIQIIIITARVSGGSNPGKHWLQSVNDDPYQEQWQRSLNLDIISISSDSIIGWYTDSWLRSRQTASSQTIRFYYLPGLFEESEIHWAGVIGARKTIKLLLADVILGSEQWNRTQTKKYLVPGGWFWWSDIISVLMRVTTW